jgi:hypothetical protein
LASHVALSENATAAGIQRAVMAVRDDRRNRGGPAFMRHADLEPGADRAPARSTPRSTRRPP